MVIESASVKLKLSCVDPISQLESNDLLNRDCYTGVPVDLFTPIDIFEIYYRSRTKYDERLYFQLVRPPGGRERVGGWVSGSLVSGPGSFPGERGSLVLGPLWGEGVSLPWPWLGSSLPFPQSGPGLPPPPTRQDTPWIGYSTGSIPLAFSRR